MQRRTYFPLQLGVRLTPEVRAWLDEEAERQKSCASTVARRFIEEAAKRSVLQETPKGA